MASTFLGQKRLRKYYGKIREVLEMPIGKSLLSKLPFWDLAS